MRLYVLLLSALFLTALSYPDARPGHFVLPAEFEPQQAVWIGARPTESGKPVLDVVIEMVRALSPHVRIRLMVPTDSVKAEVQDQLRRQKINEGQISYWTTTTSPTRWYRDVGAIFLKNNDGNLKAVDFNFNCYGECPAESVEAQKKEGIDREIAALIAGADTPSRKRGIASYPQRI